MSEKRFNCVLGKDYHIINNNVDDMTYFLQERNDVVLVTNLLNRLVEENEQLKYDNFMFKGVIETFQKVAISEINKLEKENEQLRMKLKGDDYIMVSEMLSNLRKTGICDDCKNKDKPVEWYFERGFSITGRVCDRYEPE